MQLFENIQELIIKQWLDFLFPSPNITSNIALQVLFEEAIGWAELLVIFGHIFYKTIISNLISYINIYICQLSLSCDRSACSPVLISRSTEFYYEQYGACDTSEFTYVWRVEWAAADGVVTQYDVEEISSTGMLWFLALFLSL